MDTRKLILVSVALFATAAFVRVVVWENNKLAMSLVQFGVIDNYKADAKALADGDLKLFLAGPDPPSDANVLLHPPGFPILMAIVYKLFDVEGALRFFQILLCSLAPVLILLIGLQLFEFRTAMIAALLTAFSPQFAYHSGITLPDELSVLPLLAAVYALANAVRTQSVIWMVWCGLSIGLSCWLRSNALLLPLFFAAAAVVLLPRETGAKLAITLLISFVLTISPITIRNMVVFHSFVPLSLGMGTTFLEGLGDYDENGRIGAPVTDEDVRELDVRLSGNTSYLDQTYNPDGVERDRARIKHGLGIVAANPGWFIASVAHRSISMLRMERVPVISQEHDERETTNPAAYAINAPLKLLQRAYITAVFLPLIAAGIGFLLAKKPRRRLVLLGVIPLYYMTVQALIHTEYRYVLASHHILMIFAAVGLSCLADLILRKMGGSNRTALTGT